MSNQHVCASTCTYMQNNSLILNKNIAQSKVVQSQCSQRKTEKPGTKVTVKERCFVNHWNACFSYKSRQKAV